MAVTPTGILSKPINYLRLTLAASSTFQTWVGVADAAAALAYIHLRRVATAALNMPLAVVEWDTDWARVMESAGVRNNFIQEGSFLVIFMAAVSGSHDEADAYYTFANNLGAVIAEMEVLAGTAGYLNITGIELEEPPGRPTEDEKESLVDNDGNTIGDFYQAITRVRFAS